MTICYQNEFEDGTNSCLLNHTSKSVKLLHSVTLRPVQNRLWFSSNFDQCNPRLQGVIHPYRSLKDMSLDTCYRNENVWRLGFHRRTHTLLITPPLLAFGSKNIYILLRCLHWKHDALTPPKGFDLSNKHLTQAHLKPTQKKIILPLRATEVYWNLNKAGTAAKTSTAESQTSFPRHSCDLQCLMCNSDLGTQLLVITV